MTLAPDVRPKPPPEDFAPPVAWLLGPDLIAALKRFALYALYKGDLDLRDWMAPEPVAYDAGDELWFDFISDIGDGQRAMYTTALVAQDDLWVAGRLDDARARPAEEVALPAVRGARPEGWATLPRGAFLVVGGDAAYPLADTIHLESRVREPFTWAHRDLAAAGRAADGRTADLYGVPSNHDYYDQLVGWNRMFRAPVTGEGRPGPAGEPPPL